METKTFTGPADVAEGIDWHVEPTFIFATEVDALMTLQSLGEDLQAAREQVRHLMRYMSAAVVGARRVEEDGIHTSKQAIIDHSSLARQTVFDLLAAEA